MTIFDKLQQLHPLIVILLISNILRYLNIIHKTSKCYLTSFQSAASIIVSTIIMLVPIISFIMINDLERFEVSTAISYILLSVILHALN